MEKISVIIPAYNEEKYLGRCLDSLKKQTSSPFEIIVVDNNSTDKTAEVAKNHGATKVLKCKKQGPTRARNHGAKEAKGKILAFIDADGIISKNWIERVKIYFLKENSSIICGPNIFTSKNKFKFIIYNLYNLFAFLGLFIGNKIGKYFTAVSNMAIRKELFQEIGGFPNYIAEDIKLSKNLRKYPNLNIGFSLKMLIKYSSRRFEKMGFLNTILFWIKSAFFENNSDENYKENY